MNTQKRSILVLSNRIYKHITKSVFHFREIVVPLL